MTLLGESYSTRYGATKPPFPYQPARELLLRPHEPPAPADEPDVDLDKTLRAEWQTMHPLARCFLHPPAAGRPGAGAPVRLRIVAPLCAHDGRAAQLVVAEAVRDELVGRDVGTGPTTAAAAAATAATATATANQPGESTREALPERGAGEAACRPPLGERVVAKIYDPLYYDHEQDDADPFLACDAAYAAEAAAYAALTRLQGGVVPRYYGSYSFELLETPAAAETTTAAAAGTARAVRLILMEHVRGSALRDLDPSDYSQRERQALMAAMIDAETALLAEGVFHRDLKPRNVLVVARPALTSPETSQQSLATDDAAQELGAEAAAAAAAQAPLQRQGDGHADAGESMSVGGRTLPVVLIDFGKVSVHQADGQPSPSVGVFEFIGIHVPPLLRWHRAWWSYRLDAFAAWIDWDWQPWLETCYKHREIDITEEMRKSWLPDILLQRCR